ncbi:hypothetical protein ZWY2020_034427 [Hordeum vulgare]|nr:hypothetical protein ZWY2020_034427 [Hordeum vulgare]
MDEQGERGLQLLLAAAAQRSDQDAPVSAGSDHQQLDLDLSASIGPRQQQLLQLPRPAPPTPPANESRRVAATVAASAARQLQQQQQQVTVDVRAVKQQTAEQARMASAGAAPTRSASGSWQKAGAGARREGVRAREMIWGAPAKVEQVERMSRSPPGAPLRRTRRRARDHLPPACSASIARLGWSANCTDMVGDRCLLVAIAGCNSLSLSLSVAPVL